MHPDYRRFTINRQIFPRDKNNQSKLICKHLNRPSFPYNIETYLLNRPDNSMRVALARASCIKCNQNQKTNISISQKVNKLQNTFQKKKAIIDKLEKIEIKISDKDLK